MLDAVRSCRSTDVVQSAGRNCAAAAAAAALVAVNPLWATDCVRPAAKHGTMQVQLFAPKSGGALAPQSFAVPQPRPALGWWEGAAWWRSVERALVRRGWETQPTMAKPQEPLSHARTCSRGYPNVYMEVLSGAPAQLMFTENFTADSFVATLRDQWTQKAATCCSTHPAKRWPPRVRRVLAPEHCYAIVGLRQRRGTWQAALYDPRGDTLVPVGKRHVHVRGLRLPFWLDIDVVRQNSAAIYAAIPTLTQPRTLS